MSSPPAPLAATIKALTFDVFGTCVDWRSAIEAALASAAAAKLAHADGGGDDLPMATRARLREMTAEDWAKFAQQWRASYGTFTRGFEPSATATAGWKDVDAHHRDSLVELLGAWGLAGVYDDEETARLSRAWHFLGPWPDSGAGIRRLGSRFAVATLSNGNRALLEDLVAHADLAFHRLISAEDFRAYKPRPEVYRGACGMLGLEPGEVAMVAAHLGDLAAARAVGMRTVYVERRGGGMAGGRGEVHTGEGVG